MQREYFCLGCSLFYWQDLNERTCPNCTDTSQPSFADCFACDTTGWYYFSEANKAFIKETAWSSPRFAHAHAIEVYRKQGVKILA